MIADVARRHDLIVVTDEVYEHLVYESPHLSLASLPGMAERTITISSAAKSFSVTGWKVGWACARPRAHRGDPHREAVPHLRERCAVSARDRRGTQRVR